MPRPARTVHAEVPHHITQRGNRRSRVFFGSADCATYLAWLREYAWKAKVEILAYCLMPNHVHLVAVPSDEDGLHRMLKPMHMRYAQRLNRARRWSGHVWQGRYFSSALDEPYMWAAIRYVERNPVRSTLVRRAEDYRWSSARAHCGIRVDEVLTRELSWLKRIQSLGNWSAWLREGDDGQRLATLRRRVTRGLPCGSQQFVTRLERATGRSLQERPRGRPAREARS